MGKSDSLGAQPAREGARVSAGFRPVAVSDFRDAIAGMVQRERECGAEVPGSDYCDGWLGGHAARIAERYFAPPVA